MTFQPKSGKKIPITGHFKLAGSLFKSEEIDM